MFVKINLVFSLVFLAGVINAGEPESNSDDEIKKNSIKLVH